MKLSAPSKPPADFPRFVVVGALGFAIDNLTLLSLVNAGWAPLAARAVSIPVALVATWLINRLWTFRSTSAGKTVRGIGAEFLGYCGVQLTGGVVSFAVFSVVVATIGATTQVELTAAVAAGSASALLINYLGARILVFRPKA